MNDGTTGWVKSAYLTTQEPADVRVKQLEEELDRSRATTPALAEAAARSEVEQLQARAGGQAIRTDARANAALGARPQAPQARPTPGGGGPRRRRRRGRRLQRRRRRHPSWMGGSRSLAALGVGFWLGYATLARRVKHKFGGIKVY